MKVGPGKISQSYFDAAEIASLRSQKKAANAAAALADRYFAEQCARLGPIDGRQASAGKCSPTSDKLARLSDEAGLKVSTRPTVNRRRSDGIGLAKSGAEMVDRFRL